MGLIPVTHKELIIRGERWLMRNAGCGFCLKELTCNNHSGEIPDNIGWKWGESFLLECKASRADFLGDKNKVFRKNPDIGMGNYRYYFCPPKIIKEKDLPEYWGLLYCYEKQVRMIKKAKKFPQYHKTAIAESFILQSALRRVEIRKDLNKIYNKIF